MGRARCALRQSSRVRGQCPDRIAPRLGGLCACAVALCLATPAPALAAPQCGPGRARADVVGRPGSNTAWRAGPLARTRLWRSVPKRNDSSTGWVGSGEAPWLLVLRTARDRQGRCWLRVRLPSRPNDASAWINAERVELRRTRWRIVVSRRVRTLTVYRDGRRLRRFRVVVGTPSTPTPHGLFSIVGVWPWDPADFLGS